LPIREESLRKRRNTTEGFRLSKAKTDMAIKSKRYIKRTLRHGSKTRETNPGLAKPSGVSGSGYKPRLKSRIRSNKMKMDFALVIN